MGWFCAVLRCCCIVAVMVCRSDSDRRFSPEVLLARHLERKAEDCGKIARPLRDNTQPIRVQFGLRLIDFQMDGKTNSISLSVWLRYKWSAECMQWNASLFDNISRLPFPVDKLWLPDITLVNTADTSRVERQADVLLKSNGDIFWAPHRKYKAACALDLTNYPFDIQECEMWFQSMAKRSADMQILPYYKNPFDLSTNLAPLKDSSEWEIYGNTSEVIVIPRSSGMIIMYSRRQSLLFRLKLRRRPGFLAYLLMVPCVLLSFMSAVIFCLPPERPDRNTLGMQLLTCLMLLLLLLVNVAPPTASTIPRLGLYYGFNMCMSVLAIFLSVFIVNIHNRGNRRQQVPGCVRRIILNGLGKYIFIRNSFLLNRDGRHQTDSRTTDMMTSCKIDSPNKHESSLLHADGNVCNNSEAGAELPDHLRRSLNDWKLVAMVLDRLCACLYTVILLIALAVLFPRA